jgi:hypothetical protein
MIHKAFFSAVAIALTLMAFVPYIRDIQRGKIKPHVFSWVIWGLTTFVVFLAQMQAKGGAGAWPIGISGVITIWVAVLAFMKRGDIAITRLDWMFFVIALSALPFWYFSANPLWAVAILTMVDALGFGPTFRKAYRHPFEEQLTIFVLFMARNAVSILALETYSLTTVLFPAVIALTSLLLILMVFYRRRVLAA